MPASSTFELWPATVDRPGRKLTGRTRVHVADGRITLFVVDSGRIVVDGSAEIGDDGFVPAQRGGGGQVTTVDGEVWRFARQGGCGCNRAGPLQRFRPTGAEWSDPEFQRVEVPV